MQGPALNNARIVPDVVDHVKLDEAVSMRIQYGDRIVTNGNELLPAEVRQSCCTIVIVCARWPKLVVAMASTGLVLFLSLSVCARCLATPRVAEMTIRLDVYMPCLKCFHEGRTLGYDWITLAVRLSNQNQGARGKTGWCLAHETLKPFAAVSQASKEPHVEIMGEGMFTLVRRRSVLYIRPLARQILA